MNDETVHAMADQLRQYATHFEQRDWDYTRHTKIRHIRYEGDWSGYDHPLRRLRRFLGHFRPEKPFWATVYGTRWFAWRHPIITARTWLRTEPHHPDGHLDNGGVIVHWEETGEYLQYVQPSVGALLADLMDAHPDLPEVEALAAEMKRINDAYGARCAAGEVD